MKNENMSPELKSLAKAIALLEYLAKAKVQLSLSAISRDLNITKPTLVRILSTLKAHGFVVQDADTKRYGLGWALINIGSAAYESFDLPRLIRPIMEQLSRETGESVSLMIFRNGKVINVEHILSPDNLIGGIRGQGTELELSVSASGKLFLSTMSDEEITRLLSGSPLIARTPHTLAEPRMLWDNIRRIRQQGYAFDDEEFELGCRSISVPIRDGTGRVSAALSVTGPTSRLTYDALPGLIESLRQAARRASAAIAGEVCE